MFDCLIAGWGRGHELVEEGTGGPGGEAQVLVDGRNGGLAVFAEERVVADAENGHVAGDVQFQLAAGGDDVRGVGFVEGEKGEGTGKGCEVREVGKVWEVCGGETGLAKRSGEALPAQVVDVGRAGGVPGEVGETAFEEVLRGEGAEGPVVGDDPRQLDLRAGDRQVDDGLLALLQLPDLVQMRRATAQGDERAVNAPEPAFGQAVFEDDGPGVFAGVGEDRLQPRQAERVEHHENGLLLHAEKSTTSCTIMQFSKRDFTIFFSSSGRPDVV